MILIRTSTANQQIGNERIIFNEPYTYIVHVYCMLIYVMSYEIPDDACPLDKLIKTIFSIYRPKCNSLQEKCIYINSFCITTLLIFTLHLGISELIF